MSFRKSTNAARMERSARLNVYRDLLTFGVSYLDDAMMGIFKNDLVLIGARSGAGKTQFCVNVAVANMKKGKRVHFIALEAEEYEIERRIKYQMFSTLFFENRKNWSSQRRFENDLDLRTKIDEKYSGQISYQQFVSGVYSERNADIEDIIDEKYENEYDGLFTFYKTDSFDVNDLVLQVASIASETDLVIVDHVHYFDYDDKDENNSIKLIAKTARSLALENGIPIILVSHLRKADRYGDLIPSLEEFHGSSDLYKVATKAITLAPGLFDSGGKMQTFFRIVKNRNEGSVTRYSCAINYIPSEGKYETKYKIGNASQDRESGFKEIDRIALPWWAAVS